MGMTEGMLRDQVLSRRRGEFPAEFTDQDCKALFVACLQGVTAKPAKLEEPRRKLKAKPRATARRGR
jgi:hypothetical protein